MELAPKQFSVTPQKCNFLYYALYVEVLTPQYIFNCIKLIIAMHVAMYSYIATYIYVRIHICI